MNKLIGFVPVEDTKVGDVLCATMRVTGKRETAKRVYWAYNDLVSGLPGEYYQGKGTRISVWQS